MWCVHVNGEWFRFEESAFGSFEDLFATARFYGSTPFIVIWRV